MKTLLIASLLISAIAHASNYDEVFPRYFEYCTGTQLKYQKEFFSGAVGGKGGHGFMYIHGLCKDYSKNYPQVIPCSEVKSPSHNGVGVSLDSDYMNIAWVAVPGRELMMFGETERKALSIDEIEAIASKAVDLKVFENVKMRPDYVAQHEFNSSKYQHAAAMYSMGTDLAVNLARELRCVRIPVPEKSIAEASKFLNDINDKYYKTGKEYKWDMAKNNCTHLAMNTSHAMGINSSIATDKAMVEQIFNLAIPSNAYLKYVDKTILKKQTAGRIKHSRAFRKFGFHPNQVGTLMQKLDVYPESAMFITSELEALTLPRKNVLHLLATPEKYDDKLEGSKFSDLKLSSLRWHALYSRMLEKTNNKELREYLEAQIEVTNTIKD